MRCCWNCGRKVGLNRSDRIKAEKIRCVGRRISKPRLIRWTSRHRAMEIFVEGRPAVAEVVKTWRVLRS
jgi:DNA-directed RNA polymerase subunit RPC12/RpoP